MRRVTTYGNSNKKKSLCINSTDFLGSYMSHKQCVIPFFQDHNFSHFKEAPNFYLFIILC